MVATTIYATRYPLVPEETERMTYNRNVRYLADLCSRFTTLRQLLSADHQPKAEFVVFLFVVELA